MAEQGKKIAVVIGVGAEKGLGAALCRRFAAGGYHVVVAGRTQEKIDRVAATITGDGGSASAMVCDVTDEAAVDQLFAHVENLGQLSLAIYNAGNAMPGDFLQMKSEYFELCWRVSCFGGFLFSQRAIAQMLKHNTGTLLFTGASASMRGKPFFSAFTAAKAGLRALSQSLAREFGPQGVHVGHIVVDGVIDGDMISQVFPDFAASMGSDGMVDIEGIVDIYEMMHQQSKRAWTHEIDVRTSVENF